MDKNEKYLLQYLTNYTIVPYDENKDRIFYKVNGKIQFEYNTHTKILFINEKIVKKVNDNVNDENAKNNKFNKFQYIKKIAFEYLNIKIEHVWIRSHKTYKLWRDLSDDV